MDQSSHDDSPLLDGGQGRTGEELETQTVAFSRAGVRMLIVLSILALLITLGLIS